MGSVNEPHAFISYVRDDDAAVDGLEAALEAAGIKVWRDKNALGPGDDWKRVIRQAIQGNVLAFIPCFSTAANAKDKSVMREEILLAIEEYRLRPPDRSWILSIRFDDCDIPDYDLAPGKTLRSLNWTSLFDTQYPSELIKLVDKVKLLLGTAGGPAAMTAAVGVASDRVRGSLIAAAVREGNTDATRAAEADRMVRAEARKLIEVLRDEDRLPADVDPFNSAAMLKRCEDLTRLAEPLVEAAVALGAYGQPSQAKVATDVVNSLARAGSEPRGGLHDLLNLFKLPVSQVVMAGAAGAVAAENPTMLNAFILKPEVATNYSADVAVHQLISPWDPFGNTRIADLYWKTLLGVTVEASQYDQPSRGGERYMAPQGVLKDLLKPLLRDFTIDEAGYDNLYHQVEVLVGMAIFDWSGPHVRDLEHSLSPNWVGRHVVDEKYANPNVAQRVKAQIEEEGQQWWPLRGDLLFGGDPYRAEDALTDYMKAMDSLRSSLRM